MNKLADEYRKTLEAEAAASPLPFTPLREGVEYYDATQYETALAEQLKALQNTVATMAENQLKTLRHVAELTARLETLEKRAKSKIIGVN